MLGSEGTRRSPARLLVAILAVVLVVAAGCRDDDDDSGDGGGGTGGEPATTAGFDGTTIRLGVITPQTTTAAVIGNPLTAGNQTYFDAVNDDGGIAGKYQVELDVRDSQYTPDVAAQNYAELREDVVLFQQILGTAITNALLPELEDDNLMGAPASLDAEWVHNPNLIPVGGPYQIQAINSLDYWVQTEAPDDATLCVMRQDDLYGEAAMEGVEVAAEAFGFEIGVDTQFAPTATEFTAQLQEIRGGDCDAVYLVSLPTHAITIYGEASAAGYENRWIGQAPTWVSLLAEGELGAYTTEHVWIASEGPQWGDTSVEGMAQMLDDVAEFAPEQEPDIYFAFGYVQAWTVGQILEEAVERGDLSPDGIKAAMEEIGTVSLGGLTGDYTYGNPDDREPPKTSTVFAVDPTVEGSLRALKTSFTSETAEEFDDF